MIKPNTLYNMDCMEGLKDIPDGCFDLAIVDPPYFLGPERREYYGREISSIGVKRLYRKSKRWEVPEQEYFDELFRVSKNQIVWGCNYFEYQFGPGRIVWDKCNGKSSFSDAEIAYCSVHDSVRLYRYMWNGMMQGRSILQGDVQQGNKALNEKRIHPTQKPVNLYKWLLHTYAKPGDMILDTHVGSGSSLIACEEMGYVWVGFEIDSDYCGAAQNRIDQYRQQIRMPIEQLSLI